MKDTVCGRPARANGTPRQRDRDVAEGGCDLGQVRHGMGAGEFQRYGTARRRPAAAVPQPAAEARPPDRVDLGRVWGGG